jgi:deazaflavin-dependent oxidoreductase (nitroreductase family)
MPIEGEYEPGAWDWVNDQVQQYEASSGAQGATLRETGMPIVLVTMRGHKSGKVRKIALMRVEHGGEYALIGSKGGNPTDPEWVHNLNADPDVMIQDGPAPFDARVRLVSGAERQAWWDRGVAVFPNYAEYQARTNREIPVYVASPV